MTKDDIIKLAKKAGMPMAWISDSGVLKWTDLERFAHLVAKHEREECAAMFDNHNVWDEEVGERIRARNKS
jgi:hypothetical protein